MKNYTIIIYSNNDDDLINCLNSIQNQNYNKKDIEVIIGVETGTSTIDRIINKYDFNIVVKKYKSLELESFYNDAKKIAKGKYINFSNSKILFEDTKTLNKISRKKADIIVTSIYYRMCHNNEIKNIKYKLSINDNKEVDLNNNKENINLNLESYFFNKDLLTNIDFDKKFKSESKQKFVVDIIYNHSLYYNIGKTKIYSLEAFEDQVSYFNNQHNKDWYIESLSLWRDFIKSKENIPAYIQNMLYYIIYVKYNCNYGERNKQILNTKETETFIDVTRNILEKITNCVILQYNENKNIKPHYSVQRTLKYYFYKLKNKNISKHLIDSNIVDEVPLLDLNKEKVNVYAINYNKGVLIFDCSLRIKEYLDEKDIKIRVCYGDKIVETKKTNIYNVTEVFGKTINSGYNFSFEVNIKNNFDNLKIYLLFNNQQYNLIFNFIKPESRLDNSKRAYWNYEHFTIRNRKVYLSISRRRFIKTVCLETLFFTAKFIHTKNKVRVLKLFFLRFLYFFTRPIYKNKHIWLTFDKLYKAGDNGEYVYQRGIKEHKNIYYIIKKDSPDYERLIEQNKKHILVFNSLKAKLYALHSEAVLKTHANIMGFLGFDGLARNLARGLFNAEIFEIQHGLTIQDIPLYQNRLVDNIKLYFIASPNEYNNLIQPKYDYQKNQIKNTGVARYDGLVNNDKRIILITPTWRHSVASPSLKHGEVRSYNNEFKNSDYYKIYNSLINNQKLIQNAKKYDYTICYLIHPTLSSQIDDFDKNEYVTIIPAAGKVSYEKILRESSLMITDYSGVQYDFAYMRKPIIYYHPDKLPAHYGAGGIDLKREGFGDIIKEEASLVDKVCLLMKNGCKNEIKYINRANKFFYHNDYNNSKRIIDEITRYLEEEKN